MNLTRDIRTRQWMSISAQHFLAFLFACINVPGLSARFSADPATLQRDTSKDNTPSTANPGQFSYGSDWIVGECVCVYYISMCMFPVPNCSLPCLGKVCQRCGVAPLQKTPTAMTSCEIQNIFSSYCSGPISILKDKNLEEGQETRS